MAPRRIYPLITTQEIVGRIRPHTALLGDREVEIDGRDFDELPELVDDSPEYAASGQRRHARGALGRKAFAEALANSSEAAPVDDDD